MICADITHIPVRGGFLHLVAIMDWASRFMLAWELDNTLEAGFCVGALTEALERYGAPLVSNTDRGSQFTGEAWLGVLEDAGVRISMDGRGRWIDNRFIERLWRSLKHEAVCLEELVGGRHARRVITSWLDHYNQARPHLALSGRTPAEVYFAARGQAWRQPAIRLTRPTETKRNAASNEGDEPTRKQSLALPSNCPNAPDLLYPLQGSLSDGLLGFDNYFFNFRPNINAALLNDIHDIVHLTADLFPNFAGLLVEPYPSPGQ